MKALVRKDEVYLETAWHSWIDRQTGKPLTDENYGYALCDVPSDVADDVIPEDFDIEVKGETVTDEFGETVTVKRYYGVFNAERYKGRKSNDNS